jgi:hypothetical protein
VLACQQGLGRVEADEARAAGYQNIHRVGDSHKVDGNRPSMP